MWSRVRRYVLLAPVLFVSTGGLGQVYGTMRVALTLRTGQPVPKAHVMVISVDRGDLLSFSARTDDSGQSIFSDLPSGGYKVTMKKEGCKTWEEPYVSVSADNTAEINVTLTQGDPTEKEVDDGSAISILKLDRANVATSFSLHEIESLPIFLQNVSLFELLVPGAVRTSNVLSPEQNPQNGVYASLSGQHFSGTEVVLDGTVNRDPLQGIIVLNSSLDSVSELKITTQNYGAEFGPATGGVVSIQTRSGTNQLHGSAFGYRVSGLGQATTPNFGLTSFLLASAEKRDDFGASLGGPMIRDRLFLFGDFRGIRQRDDGTILLTVPIQTVHTTCTGLSDGSYCNLQAYLNAGAACNAPCVGGMIPNNIVSPQMVNFLKMIPMPDYGASDAVTNNFTASGVDSFANDNFDIRADYAISSKLRTFTRYSFASFTENGSPALGAAVGGPGTNPFKFAGVMKDRNQGISSGLSANLNPTLLTDFRFGFLRYNLRMDSLDTGTAPAANAGIGGLNLGTFYTAGMPDIELDNPNISGLPIAGNLDFMRLGYSPTANICDCPLREREQEFQFVDDWTKLFGKHTIRWGADFRYLQNYRLSSDERPAGHLEFQNFAQTANSTGFALGDFLIGNVADFARSYANPENPAALNAGERQKRIFFYGEDTWRVSSRLTFNYGLRWEIYVPQTVTGAGAGGWLELGSGTPPVNDQILVAGEGGTNLQGNVKMSWKNFGPRIGLAYLINRKTVIRAGYGRMFDPGYAGTIFGIAATQSPPVSVITTVTNGFTINSNANPTTITPLDVCTPGMSGAPGACDVPKFVFPPGAFTISNLYNSNLITSPNPKLASAIQQADLYAMPRRLRLPTVDAWNVAIQEQLDRHTYLEVAYVANKGTHVLTDSTGDGSQVPYYDLNQPTLKGFIGKPAAKGSQNAAANCRQASFIRDFGSPPNGTTAYCKILAALRTPFNPWGANVLYLGNNASSNYSSLQVKVRHQFSSGYSLLANYAWSKVIDFDNLSYAIDPGVSRGVGNFDRKHTFVMTNVWDLPVGRGQKLLGDARPVLNWLVGGWSLAAITSWFSGLPFTPTYSVNECNQDIDSGNFHTCQPNLVGEVHITGSRNQYFTTTGGPLSASCAPLVTGASMVESCPSTVWDPATSKKIPTPTGLQGYDPTTGQPLPGPAIGPWQRPGAGQIGDVGRNSFRGPGFFQSDLALAKNISITERVGVQFRADAFNVLNKVNLANPSPVVDSPSGGTITSLVNGAIQRQMQFSVRVNF
jgi:outer membrane receptor protein involved in Fe transport